MMGRGTLRAAALAAAGMGVIVLTGPAEPAQRHEQQALARIEPGLWQLEDDEGRQTSAPMCLGDPSLLTQVQHGTAPCSRLVLSADPRRVTVHYTCPAAGFGRTTLRVETPRLVRIDSQGIFEGAPFAFRARARRIGSCPDGAVRRRR